ncbi:MAG: helix-turn-helix transcriptional regulator [Burkholderiaceae bacterium]
MDAPIALRAVLDVAPVPILVLSASARIDHANAAADLLLARHAAWLQRRNGILARIGTLEAPEIRALIRAVQAEASPPDGHAAVTTAQARPVVIRASNLAGSFPFAQAWPAAAVLLTIEYPRDRDDSEWLRHVARRFGLTSTERIVLERIGAGATVAAIARELDVLPSTIRTHLAALFDKTGCRRQSALIRLALGR